MNKIKLIAAFAAVAFAGAAFAGGHMDGGGRMKGSLIQ